MPKGRILHAISGFYYVEADGALLECKAKGTFRKDGRTPLAGDLVEVETSRETGKAFITDILERKNFLLRPPIANLDRLFIVVSAARPRPNLYVLDKLTAFAVYHGISPVIVFSKSDLEDPHPIAQTYTEAGFPVIVCSTVTGEGLDALSRALETGVCAFSGNSGVGKSSLINVLMPELQLQTNEISDKLGRGRHTTRSVRLYPYRGGYLADTPGFSSLDFENNGEQIPKEALISCFPDLAAFSDQCRFYPSCSHVADKGCAVRRAVAQGNAQAARHESYIQMYEELKKLKPRY